MNSKKIFTLSALAAGLLALVAFAPAWADVGGSEGQSQEAYAEAQEHMWQMRDIMHYAAFAAQPAEDGVVVNVTSTDAKLAEAIRHEFGERHELVAPLEGSTVTAAEIDGGVALTFTATDPATVQTLQGYGVGLAYTMLRDNMHATMWSFRGANPQGFGPGPGMMGPGYGRGYGPGNGRGYGMHGPGMMGPGYGRGYGPGYGHGMMGGGYGPGYGPGPRWNQGQGK